jgi:hypothetical protein
MIPAVRSAINPPLTMCSTFVLIIETMVEAMAASRRSR